MIESGETGVARGILALEVCTDTPEGVRAAARAGADRIEICSALDLGGLSPGPGLIAAAAEATRQAGLPAHMLIRPRAGDFTATAAELDAMCADVAAARAAGLAGVVIGVRDAAGGLDRDALERLATAAGPLALTLHRVIDTVADPCAALEMAVGLGFRRVLSSGGAPRAGDGLDGLARLVAQAAGRIEIMAGGGVTPAQVPALIATGIDALHGSCRAPADTPAQTQTDGFGFGTARQTDPQAIAALMAAMHQQRNVA